MKLFVWKKVIRGEIMPFAFISAGIFSAKTFYFRILIPLFVLAWKYDVTRDTYRFGWWIPSFAFRITKGEITWKWWFVFHSDLMGEKLELESFDACYDVNL